MAKPMKNILCDRRDGSDLIWAVRDLKPVRTYSSQSSLNLDDVPGRILELVFSQCMEESDYKDKDSLYDEIKSMIDEIHCSYNQPLLRCLGILFSKLLKHFYSGVLVNEDAIFELKKVVGNAPVIFVPSHKSYCDFIIMAYVCFAFEIEVPCVAAAIDFSSMKVIGNVLRNCKAFFIRRNFNSDPLYKNIIQKFLQYLIIQGNSPVEFFIEGTRSRTGKSLPPKFGLLKTIVDTFIEKDIPDLIILPIGISYDRILEDLLFSYESLGIPKPPESTKGFFKALASLEEKYGNIYINVGEPIYLKSFMMNYDLPSWTTDSNYILEKLGFRVVKEQQKLQKVLCIHLLSLLLYDSYIKYGFVSLHFKSACSQVQLLKNTLRVFGADVYLCDDITQSLHESLVIHKSLFSLSDNNEINLAPFDIKVSEINGKKLKGAALNEEIIRMAIPILRIQQYINPLLAVLASPAIVIALAHNCVTYEKLQEKYIFFREIFLNEFIFCKEDEVKDFQISVEKLSKLGLIKIFDGNNVALNKEDTLASILSFTIYPFITTYLNTCRIIMCGNGKQTLDNIFQSCQLLIQDEIEKCCYYHHASLSLDSIGFAVNMLLRLQVISKKTDCDIYETVNISLLHYIINELDLLQRSYYYCFNKEKTEFSLLISKL